MTSLELNTIRPIFKRFLATGGYCTPPGKAACALNSAKVLLEWREMERAGLVRLVAEPEVENYFDVYGHESPKRDKEISDLIERWGCYWVASEFRTERGWIPADSIGMCIYQNPLDPFENDYIVELMRQAMSHVELCGEH